MTMPWFADFLTSLDDDQISAHRLELAHSLVGSVFSNAQQCNDRSRPDDDA